MKRETQERTLLAHVGDLEKREEETEREREEREKQERKNIINSSWRSRKEREIVKNAPSQSPGESAPF